jgi:hypothetical protein
MKAQEEGTLTNSKARLVELALSWRASWIWCTNSCNAAIRARAPTTRTLALTQPKVRENQTLIEFNREEVLADRDGGMALLLEKQVALADETTRY